MAKNHSWDHTYPVACHLHSTHIKYLRHLLNLPSSSQLYKIIRGTIAQQRRPTNHLEMFAPFYRPIVRTIQFMEVNELLEQGLYTIHARRQTPGPYEYIQYISQPRPWTVTLRMFDIKDLTNIVKTFGRHRFMQQYRRELLRMRDQDSQQQEVPASQDASGIVVSTIDEVSTIGSGISEGDVSVGSHVSNTEEELNELTTEQLLAYLLTLAPTTIPPRSHRRHIIAQLIPIIQSYNQIQHRDQRQAEAQRLLLYTAIREDDFIIPAVDTIQDVQHQHLHDHTTRVDTLPRIQAETQGVPPTIGWDHSNRRRRRCAIYRRERRRHKIPRPGKI